MSNRIEIQLTKFVNLDHLGNVQDDFSFGYRIYDDYADVYNNTFESLEDLLREVHEDNFWEVLSDHDEFKDIDDLTCSGISFNGTSYTWNEIKEIKEEIQRRDEKNGLYPDKEDISN